MLTFLNQTLQQSEKCSNSALAQQGADSFELMNSIILLYHATVKLPFKQRAVPVWLPVICAVAARCVAQATAGTVYRKFFQNTIAIAFFASDDSR
jgi:hypothetical protein